MDNQVQHWCGPKPGDPSPIIYHGGIAGPQGMLNAFVEGDQARFCISYYKIKLKRPEISVLGGGGRRFLDSGAFSFLADKNKTVSPRDWMKDYAQWVLTSAPPLDFYITFDHRPDAKLTLAATKYLRRQKTAPTPVYHGDASLDYLRRYAGEGYQLISLSKRCFLGDHTGLAHFYDQCFDLGAKLNLHFHGLASGVGPEVWRYPFWSVDSTSVVRSAALGSVYVITPHGKLSAVMVSALKGKTDLVNLLATYCERWKVTIEELQTSPYRRMYFSARTIGLLQEQRKPKQWKRKTLF